VNWLNALNAEMAKLMFGQAFGSEYEACSV